MGFLADIGLVEAGRGQYAITEQGRAFAVLWSRDPARARLLLHPLLQAHWSATAVTRHLASGPLPQAKLAELLGSGLPGVRARGMYLVEWLVIGLVVERDEQLHVRLAATDASAPPKRSEADTAAEESVSEDSDASGTAGGDGSDDASGSSLLGMTFQEIKELPEDRYTAFLEGVLQILDSALAPTA